MAVQYLRKIRKTKQNILLFGFLVCPLTGDENVPSPAEVVPAILMEYSVLFLRPVIVAVVGEGDCEARRKTGIKNDGVKTLTTKIPKKMSFLIVSCRDFLKGIYLQLLHKTYEIE